MITWNLLLSPEHSTRTTQWIAKFWFDWCQSDDIGIRERGIAPSRKKEFYVKQYTFSRVHNRILNWQSGISPFSPRQMCAHYRRAITWIPCLTRLLWLFSILEETRSREGATNAEHWNILNISAAQDVPCFDDVCDVSLLLAFLVIGGTLVIAVTTLICI